MGKHGRPRKARQRERRAASRRRMSVEQYRDRPGKGGRRYSSWQARQEGADDAS